MIFRSNCDYSSLPVYARVRLLTLTIVISFDVFKVHHKWVLLMDFNFFINLIVYSVKMLFFSKI